MPSVLAWRLDNTPAVFELARSRLDARVARERDAVTFEIASPRFVKSTFEVSISVRLTFERSHPPGHVLGLLSCDYVTVPFALTLEVDESEKQHLDELISESPVSFLVLDICL